ncbi:MAG: sigma 54-interacting transcriptional regulator [Deltaproteobacteria bacterium]|jgi:hypothetical protein|nr:sigma 54-interacting transcriptional regulator [Deltaproteobacteria bacterium]
MPKIPIRNAVLCNPDPVLLLDEFGSIVHANEAAGEALGLRPAQLDGVPFGELGICELVGPPRAPQGALAARRFRIVRPERTGKVMLLAETPVAAGRGEPDRLLVCGRDLSRSPAKKAVPDLSQLRERELLDHFGWAQARGFPAPPASARADAVREKAALLAHAGGPHFLLVGDRGSGKAEAALMLRTLLCPQLATYLEIDCAQVAARTLEGLILGFPGPDSGRRRRRAPLLDVAGRGAVLHFRNLDSMPLGLQESLAGRLASGAPPLPVLVFSLRYTASGPSALAGRERTPAPDPPPRRGAARGGAAPDASPPPGAPGAPEGGSPPRWGSIGRWTSALSPAVKARVSLSLARLLKASTLALPPLREETLSDAAEAVIESMNVRFGTSLVLNERARRALASGGPPVDHAALRAVLERAAIYSRSLVRAAPGGAAAVPERARALFIDRGGRLVDCSSPEGIRVAQAFLFDPDRPVPLRERLRNIERLIVREAWPLCRSTRELGRVLGISQSSASLKLKDSLAPSARAGGGDARAGGGDGGRGGGRRKAGRGDGKDAR